MAAVKAKLFNATDAEPGAASSQQTPSQSAPQPAPSPAEPAPPPLLQRVLQALALAPPMAVQQPPAQPPPELLVRRSTRAEAEDLWHSVMTGEETPALTESPVPLHSLPYTWQRLALRRGDGSIYELPHTFVRLPNGRSATSYFYPSCRKRNSCLGKRPFWEARSPEEQQHARGSAATPLLRACSTAELQDLQTMQTCASCKALHSIDELFFCDCGLFFCDVLCTQRSGCPHTEELHLARQMLQDVCKGSGEEALPQCHCRCCTERFGFHSQASLVGEH